MIGIKQTKKKQHKLPLKEVKVEILKFIDKSKIPTPKKNIFRQTFTKFDAYSFPLLKIGINLLLETSQKTGKTVIILIKYKV